MLLSAASHFARSVRCLLRPARTGQSSFGILSEPRAAHVAGHRGGVLVLAFAADGRFLASGAPTTWFGFGTRTRVMRCGALQGHTGDVYGLAFSPDGKTLASTGTDGTLRTWDPTSGLPRTDYRSGNMTAMYGVAFGPLGRIATAGEDHQVRIWDGR